VGHGHINVEIINSPTLKSSSGSDPRGKGDFRIKAQKQRAVVVPPVARGIFMRVLAWIANAPFYGSKVNLSERNENHSLGSSAYLYL
jgi:hypothetical protein